MVRSKLLLRLSYFGRKARDNCARFFRQEKRYYDFRELKMDAGASSCIKIKTCGNFAELKTVEINDILGLEQI